MVKKSSAGNNNHAGSYYAKRMVLRSPNQTIQKKSERLRQMRIAKEKIEPERLQKVLAASGLGSRRHMERLIEAGKVTINDQTAELGTKVGINDRIKINNKLIKLSFPDRLPRILLYYKRPGEIVSRKDFHNRKTVFEQIKLLKDPKWRSIGRLDVNTSGLLIFTTSGDLINRFSHPRYSIDREYIVRLNGSLSVEQMQQLTTTGVMLADGRALAVKIAARETTKNNSNQYYWYDITIQEGRNREVRRIFEYFHLTVSRLIRIRFGPIAIPPRLKSGHYYELNGVEVDYVLKAMGMLRKTNNCSC